MRTCCAAPWKRRQNHQQQQQRGNAGEDHRRVGGFCQVCHVAGLPAVFGCNVLLMS